jgi:hypothetical protein
LSPRESVRCRSSFVAVSSPLDDPGHYRYLLDE